jgi:hypothetical protein
MEMQMPWLQEGTILGTLLHWRAPNRHTETVKQACLCAHRRADHSPMAEIRLQRGNIWRPTLEHVQPDGRNNRSVGLFRPSTRPVLLCPHRQQYTAPLEGLGLACVTEEKSGIGRDCFEFEKRMATRSRLCSTSMRCMLFRFRYPIQVSDSGIRFRYPIQVFDSGIRFR